MSILLLKSLVSLVVQLCFSNDNPVFNLPPNIQSTLLLDKHKILKPSNTYFFLSGH